MLVLQNLLDSPPGRHALHSSMVIRMIAVVIDLRIASDVGSWYYVMKVISAYVHLSPTRYSLLFRMVSIIMETGLISAA